MIGWQIGYAVAQKLEQSGNWDASISVLSNLYRNGENRNAKIAYRLGHAYFNQGNLEIGSKYISEAIAIDSTKAHWSYRLGFINEKLQNWPEALTNYNHAISLDATHAEWFYRRSKVNAAQKLTDQAREDIRSASAISPENSRYKTAMAEGMARTAPLWQQIRHLEQNIEQNATDGKWHHQMGEIYFQMGQFGKSASSFKAACDIFPNSSLWQYQLGLSLERSEALQASEVAYERAIELDKKLNSKRFGIGTFHQRRGDWASAQKAYLKTQRKTPNDAQLCFKLGVAYGKTYNWIQAERTIKLALTLDPKNAQWHYQLGFTLERQNNYSAAIGAYDYAVRMSTDHKQYWIYRLGSVMTQAGRFEEACAVFDRFINTPSQHQVEMDSPVPSMEETTRDAEYLSSIFSPMSDPVLGRRTLEQLAASAALAEQHGDFEFAKSTYEVIANSSPTHVSRHWHGLGRALAANGQFEPATRAYKDMMEIKSPHGLDLAEYSKNTVLRTLMTYSEMLDTLSINENLVLFESNHGSSIGCNPYAIYQEIAQDPEFSTYKFIWIINDSTRAPADVIEDQRVILVPRGSQLYNRYLASAKYLINNNTFPPYFTRRDEQRYLNTWHGTPLKTLGKDIPSNFLEHKNATRNFLQATDFIMPNIHTIDILLDKYDIKDVSSARVGLTGYPRNDRTVNLSDESRTEIYSRMNLDPNKPVVLYAPTWRGSLGQSKFDIERLVSDLRELKSNEYQIIFRGHQNTEKLLVQETLDATVVPTDIDTNSLLSVVDVLITDYSSISFDYLSLQKPIIYYTYDLEIYVSERGLYFDMDSLPGANCGTLDEVKTVLGDYSLLKESPDSSYVESLQKFAPFDDGKATKRAVDFFFRDDQTHEYLNESNAHKKTLLFYQGSFIPNGIMIAFLGLLAMLPESEFNICLVVDPDQIANYPERREQFDRLPEHVRVFAKVGAQPLTGEERAVTTALWNNHNLDSLEQWAIVERSFQREFDHTFGAGTKFDAVINFEGYVRYWEALFAFGGNPSRRIAYLHSDMNKEWKERFSHLESVFRLYSQFDELISVGDSSYEENQAQLAPIFDIDKAKFKYVNNPLDVEQIQQGALEPADDELAAWCRHAEGLFVSVGRLSPEKDHVKLIRSFAQVLETEKHARLVIVGDGNLMPELRALTTELEITNSVRFVGALINPYPVIALSDCFVFPSNYEGQGLAILEALILGKPVVSTDITGARGLLRDGYGMLVENSVDGLAQGMLSYYSGGIPCKPFDVLTYQKTSRGDFYQNVLGITYAN